jgi:hypothetical protein
VEGWANCSNNSRGLAHEDGIHFGDPRSPHCGTYAGVRVLRSFGSNEELRDKRLFLLLGSFILELQASQHHQTRSLTQNSL